MSMGKQHSSKPVTAMDKMMSKRHLQHRAEIKVMKAGPAKMKKSMMYNEAHAKEHIKAMKDTAKKIKKSGKDAKADRLKAAAKQLSKFY